MGENLSWLPFSECLWQQPPPPRAPGEDLRLLGESHQPGAGGSWQLQVEGSRHLEQAVVGLAGSQVLAGGSRAPHRHQVGTSNALTALLAQRNRLPMDGKAKGSPGRQEDGGGGSCCAETGFPASESGAHRGSVG